MLEKKNLIKSKHIRIIHSFLYRGVFISIQDSIYLPFGLYSYSIYLFTDYRIFLVCKGAIKYPFIQCQKGVWGGDQETLSVFDSLCVFKSAISNTTPVRLRKEFKAIAFSYLVILSLQVFVFVFRVRNSNQYLLFSPIGQVGSQRI